ncbi:MAG: helix-turn-helix domain-containing protein [Endomicrobium sp.]|nr:helix-turn-helix domain-containing protein [Endomicrobium sp.]
MAVRKWFNGEQIPSEHNIKELSRIFGKT